MSFLDLSRIMIIEHLKLTLTVCPTVIFLRFFVYKKKQFYNKITQSTMIKLNFIAKVIKQ